MDDEHRIVAVGLLRARDLERLGARFELAFPLVGDHAFENLIVALDRIEWPHRAGENIEKVIDPD